MRRNRRRRTRQQELQHALRELEQTGSVARIKGNRYIQPREADLRKLAKDKNVSSVVRTAAQRHLSRRQR